MNKIKNFNNKIPIWGYIFIGILLLIPIFSIEGVISWGIGLIGAYKVRKILIDNISSSKKINKTLKITVFCLIIALTHYILVTKLTEIFVKMYI